MKEENQKPECHNTMLLSIIVNKTKECKTLVLPLLNFHIDNSNEDIIKFKVNKLHLDLGIKNAKAIFCISDDPYMEWAGDWSHLGCFRLRITLDNFWTETDKNNDTIFICNKKDFAKKTIFPGRVYEDDVKTELLV